MPDDKRAEFFAEMAEICQTSGLVEAVDHKPHISMPDDAYAPVFRASAVAELRFQDKDHLQKMNEYQPLADFRTKWQALYPYKVVWVNHDPLFC
jgi:hypothetical protein